MPIVVYSGGIDIHIMRLMLICVVLLLRCDGHITYDARSCLFLLRLKSVVDLRPDVVYRCARVM